MGEYVLMSVSRRAFVRAWKYRPARACLAAALAGAALAGCAQPQYHSYQHGKEYFPEGRYGVASPRVVADGQPVPRGGGQYLVGHPYTIAGRTYYPTEGSNFTAVGMASWYGSAFHGRRTANGEVYDMAAISAAHPTMPLPSYARVTNMANGYSVVVRVNDRGPYSGGRVMDVSSRAADLLAFKGAGTAKVKIEYIGRAPLEGSDDTLLASSLRTDGSPASLPGYASSVMLADNAPSGGGLLHLFGRPAAPPPPPPPDASSESDDAEPAPAPARHPRIVNAPQPPERPYDLGAASRPRPPLLLARAPLPPLRLSSNDSALYFTPPPHRADDPLARLLRPRPVPLAASDDDN